MDVVLSLCDHYFFTPYIYPAWIPEDNIWRQFLSLNIVVDLGGAILYLMTASIAYHTSFDRRYLKHPQILKNQVQREIMYTMKSIPGMGLLTCILFQLEVRGYSRLYDNIDDLSFGWVKFGLSIITFLMFTDCLIYWIHRGLHHRLVYKTIHKPHHMWKITTPFASHAFHPLDGFAQSTPYHIYVFLFPMHKWTYIALYIAVNVWTVSIHDGDFKVPQCLENIVNGAAHHTDHHLYYNYNYGQYLTLWDKLGGSFRKPSAMEGNGPLDQIERLEKKREEHTKEK